MSTFVVPPIEGDQDFPSLGDQVAAWQEAMLAFGPGDLLGRPYKVDPEGGALLDRMYQVYPPQHRGRCRFDVANAGWRCTIGNGLCGRRRFGTGVLVKRKGTLKSEQAAAIAAAEVASDSPVRCDGFRRVGSTWVPIGRPVVSPFVFVFAFAKEQAEDTSFDAMRAMIEQGPGSSRFEVYEEKILTSAGGEAKAMATAPDSKDGGKTTFQVKEETHRWVLPRHKEAHQTTRGNLSKRPLAEPWELHATTMYAPGEQSVLETVHEGVRKLSPDEARNSRTFFFYRFADPKIKIRDDDGHLVPAEVRRAVIDASGPHAAWSDIDDIVTRQFLSEEADPDYAERVWLNRPRQRLADAFDSEAWKRNIGVPTDPETGEDLVSDPELASPLETTVRLRIHDGAQIVLSFDGARGTSDPNRSPDTAGLLATELATGLQVVIGHWNPIDYEDRHIPRDLVDAAVDDAFERYDVWRLYADPPDWDSEIAAWVAKYGKDRIVEWFTWRDRAMGLACASYSMAITLGEVRHGQQPALTAHIGNARRRYVNARDDKGDRLWTISKEREGSQLKIDLAVCGVLGWEARSDAIAAGIVRDAGLEPFILVGRPL